MKRTFPLESMTLAFLLLTACAFEAKKEKPAALPLKACESLFGLAPETLAEWKMQNHQHLVICEMFESKKESDSRFTGWLNIALQTKKGLMPFIQDVNSETPSELVTFAVEKKSEQEVVIERRLLLSAGKSEDSVLLTETVLDCSVSPCMLKKPRCLRPQKNLAGSNMAAGQKVDIATVQKVIAGKLKTSKISNYDMKIKNVAAAAVLGNKDAEKIILGTSSEKLHVDGTASAVYEEGRELLQNLKDLGCL